MNVILISLYARSPATNSSSSSHKPGVRRRRGLEFFFFWTNIYLSSPYPSPTTTHVCVLFSLLLRLSLPHLWIVVAPYVVDLLLLHCTALFVFHRASRGSSTPYFPAASTGLLLRSPLHLLDNDDHVVDDDHHQLISIVIYYIGLNRRFVVKLAERLFVVVVQVCGTQRTFSTSPSTVASPLTHIHPSIGAPTVRVAATSPSTLPLPPPLSFYRPSFIWVDTHVQQVRVRVIQSNCVAPQNIRRKRWAREWWIKTPSPQREHITRAFRWV